MRESWFEIKAQAAGTPGSHADIYILDEIGGFGVSAGQLIAAVQSTGASSLTVFLDTPGGSISQGLAIANFLTDFAIRPGNNVTTHVLGMAASMGAIILQAGRTRTMAASSYAMLHDPTTWGIGNAEEFRLIAEWLDRMGGTLAQLVARRTGQPLEKVSAWMTSNETWFDADQAKEAKLIDEIAPAITVEARYSTQRFHSLPAAISSRPAPAPQIPSLMNKFAQLLGLGTATPPPATPAPTPTPPAPAAPPAPPAPSARETFMISVLDAFGITPEALATAQADNKPGFAHDFVKAKLDDATARAAKVDTAFAAAGLAITAKDIADGTKDLKALVAENTARETARMAASAGGQPAGRQATQPDSADDAEDLDSVRAQLETETSPEKRACLARKARKLRTGSDRII